MRNHSKLLIGEHPLMVLPSLAVKLGLPEAMFVQQLHYWLEKSKHEKDGYFWVYNTHEDWHEQFPFYSVSTIRRAIKNLEKQGIIVTGSFNKMKLDKTKWYRLDYDAIDNLDAPCVQNEQMERSKRADEQPNLDRPLPEITTEITSESSTTTAAEPSESIIEFFERNLMVRISPVQAQKLFAFLDDFHGQEAIIKRAIEIACDKNKRYFGFVEMLLREWAMNKAETLDAIEKYEKEKFANKGFAQSAGKTGGSKFSAYRE